MPELRTTHARAWMRRRAVRRLFVQPEGTWDLDDPGAGRQPALTDWLARQPPSDLHLTLSGRLVHPLLVAEHALGRASDADRQAWTRQQYLLYHGPAAADWPLAVWFDPPWLAAAALHGADMAGWKRAALEHGSRMSSVQPWWATAPVHVAARRAGWPGPGRSALVLAEGVHVAWLGFHGGRVVELVQRRAAAASTSALAELVGAWQARAGVDAAATLLVGFGVEGAVSELGAHVLDDLAAAAPPTQWMTAG